MTGKSAFLTSIDRRFSAWAWRRVRLCSKEGAKYLRRTLARADDRNDCRAGRIRRWHALPTAREVRCLYCLAKRWPMAVSIQELTGWLFPSKVASPGVQTPRMVRKRGSMKIILEVPRRAGIPAHLVGRHRLRFTTEHPSSSYGLGVLLDEVLGGAQFHGPTQY